MAEQWLFTFGFDHTHPITNESLSGCYVIIEGDVETSREEMIKHFGTKWAMQYRPAAADTAAMINKYHLRQVPVNGATENPL